MWDDSKPLQPFLYKLSHKLLNVLFKGVKKMVVVENLLYILDTEVSSLAWPVAVPASSLINIKNEMILWFIPGYPESLGPPFPGHDSLLAWSCHRWLWAHHRMWLHDGVRITFFIISCTNSSASVWQHWKRDSSVYRSQDKGSMRLITLTKQKNSQVGTRLLLQEAWRWSGVLFWTSHAAAPMFQIDSLQFRSLPSMTVCYSLDVSSVSCLVQTKINMVRIQSDLTFSYTLIFILFWINIFFQPSDFRTPFIWLRGFVRTQKGRKPSVTRHFLP